MPLLAGPVSGSFCVPERLGVWMHDLLMLTNHPDRLGIFVGAEVNWSVLPQPNNHPRVAVLVFGRGTLMADIEAPLLVRVTTPSKCDSRHCPAV
jgi:hypothetical protein